MLDAIRNRSYTHTSNASQSTIEDLQARQDAGEELSIHEQQTLRNEVAGDTTTTESGEGATTETQNQGVSLHQDSFEAHRSIGEAQGEFGNEEAAQDTSVNGVHGSGRVAGPTLGVEGENHVNANLSEGQLEAGGSIGARANLLEAEGSAGANYDVAGVDASTSASGRAHVGAEASAGGDVTLDPMNGDLGASVGGEAFAGARASVEAEQTVGPVGGRVGAEAFAGVGAEFEADLGVEDGKLNAQVDVGAALGVGGSLEFGFSVDAGAIASGVGDAAAKLNPFA